MEQSVSTTASGSPSYQEVWERVVGQLRMELSKVQYDTWVNSLQPMAYQQNIFTLSACNQFGKEWVESRLKSRITRLLEGMLAEPVDLRVVVSSPLTAVPGSSNPPVRAAPPKAQVDDGDGNGASKRKMLLQRAYGSERARIIQPERGMFLTLYFFYEWIPLIGHSAAAVILAARSMCYWNPMTGELRNTVETDMSELAHRASVSIRTVKEVLNSELVQRYFLRYKVRRNMTPNGVRTAGIYLQVRMDDPLTPEDQSRANLQNEDEWYLAEFGEK